MISLPGQWMSKFDSANTKANNFYIKRDQITVTEFMEQKGKFNYYTSEELRAHVLEMPYIGEEVRIFYRKKLSPLSLAFLPMQTLVLSTKHLNCEFSGIYKL